MSDNFAPVCATRRCTNLVALLLAFLTTTTTRTTTTLRFTILLCRVLHNVYDECMRIDVCNMYLHTSTYLAVKAEVRIIDKTARRASSVRMRSEGFALTCDTLQFACRIGANYSDNCNLIG